MSGESSPESLVRQRVIKTLSAITTVALTASGCSKPTNSNFKGGCKSFVVYAQNRWVPYGAAERSEPDKKAQKIGSYAPNEVITVNGWLHSGVKVYPDNQAPFNNDVWFHDANKPHGFVSFAGVRAELTQPDPTLRADGEPSAPLSANCEGTYKK